MTQRADIAVVGLGIVGSAIAARLSRTGRIVGIDRYAPPHLAGSSHGENRIIRAAPGEGAVYAELAARSFAQLRELSARNALDLLHETGGFDASLAPSLWAAEVREICRTYNLPFEAVDGRAFRASHGNYALPDDSEIVLQPGFGHVAAELTWQAFLDEARDNGADLQFGRAVRAIDFGDPCTIAFEDGETLEAGQLVLATGGWLNQLLDRPLNLRVERRVLGWYPIERRLGPVLPFCFIDGPNDGFWYGMPARDGTMLKIGAHYHLREIVDPDAVAPVGPADLDLLDSFIARFTRGIAPHPVATATCKYTLTASEDFVIDRHPAHANVLVFSCCSGHGFKYAPVYGEIAEALLAGRSYPVDLARFAIDPHLAASSLP